MLTMGLVVGACIATGLLIMLPKRIVRRAAGYMMVTDAGLSMYGISSGSASASVVGLLGGFIGAILLSIGIRGEAYFVGAERLAINGSTDVRLVASAAMSQAVIWVRNTIFSLWNGEQVTPPTAMEWSWIEVAPAHTMSDLVTEIMGLFTRMRVEIPDF